MSKAEACFEAIKTENIKTLHWSLRYGGCSATKPYDEECAEPFATFAPPEPFS